MTFDALTALRAAGHPVDLVPEAQRAVLAALGETEVAILNSIKQRLETGPGAEVEGQNVLGSGLF